jgi:hypothetical protein
MRLMEETQTSTAVDQNRLLASLPLEEYKQLREHLVPTTLPYKSSLYQAYEPIQFVLFVRPYVC